MTRLAVAAALSAVLLGSLTPAANAAPTMTSSCAGTVQITHLAFTSAMVTPGQTATLRLAARNCTTQTVASTLTFTARYESSSPGVPPGCPVIDPFAKQVTFAPLGTDTDRVGYLTFPSCTTTTLRATATFTGSEGAILDQATTTVTIVGPPVALAPRQPTARGI